MPGPWSKAPNCAFRPLVLSSAEVGAACGRSLLTRRVFLSPTRLQSSVGVPVGVVIPCRVLLGWPSVVFATKCVLLLLLLLLHLQGGQREEQRRPHLPVWPVARLPHDCGLQHGANTAQGRERGMVQIRRLREAC